MWSSSPYLYKWNLLWSLSVINSFSFSIGVCCIWWYLQCAESLFIINLLLQTLPDCVAAWCLYCCYFGLDSFVIAETYYYFFSLLLHMIVWVCVVASKFLQTAGSTKLVPSPLPPPSAPATTGAAGIATAFAAFLAECIQDCHTKAQLWCVASS